MVILTIMGDVLGRRIDDEVDAKLDRPLQERRGEDVVDHETRPVDRRMGARRHAGFRRRQTEGANRQAVPVPKRLFP
jgi:hypothetical protein